VKILVSSIDADPTIKASLKKQLIGQLKKLKLEHEYGAMEDREEYVKAIDYFNTQIQKSNPSLYSSIKDQLKALKEDIDRSVQSESDDGNVPTEVRDHMMFDEIIEEPKLSTSQLKQIMDVIKILEEQPALKNDIRRTIVEELKKGYMKPEQFKEYNQAIEEAGIKEAPSAVRARKTPKPRAKKSKQADIYILPTELEHISKLPKGKEIKNIKKRKLKIVTN